MKNSGKSQRGILVAVEGISASGKSEYINTIYKEICSTNLNTVIIKWNSNPLLKKITAFLYDNNLLTPGIYSIIQLLSFIFDYAVKYKKYFKRNYIVIADRYLLTGIIRDMTNGIRPVLNRWLYSIVRKPDILIFCHIDPQICVQRIHKRKKQFFMLNKKFRQNNDNARLPNGGADPLAAYLISMLHHYQQIIATPAIIAGSKLIVVNGSFSAQIKEILDDIIQLKPADDITVFTIMQGNV